MEIQNSTDETKDLKKVLLVENDIFSIELVKKILNNLCILDVASEGLTAVNMAQRTVYDAVLMDINLGIGMTGIDITKMLRNLPGYALTPIIAVTAYATKDHKDTFLSSGMTHFIPKPINIVEFKKIMNSVLGD